MSQDQLRFQPTTRRIEILLDTKDSVGYFAGCLRCHLTQEAYRFAERLLWQAILKDAITRERLTISNAAICRSKERKR